MLLQRACRRAVQALAASVPHPIRQHQRWLRRHNTWTHRLAATACLSTVAARTTHTLSVPERPYDELDPIGNDDALFASPSSRPVDDGKPLSTPAQRARGVPAPSPSRLPPSPMVDPKWVQSVLRHEHVRCIDASWYMPAAQRRTYDEYLGCRLPHARFFDIDTFVDDSPAVRASGLPHTWPTPTQFARHVEQLGLVLTPEHCDACVVYDSDGLFSAARAWYMLRAHGVPDARVCVLSGGLRAWRDERLDTGARTSTRWKRLIGDAVDEWRRDQMRTWDTERVRRYRDALADRQSRALDPDGDGDGGGGRRGGRFGRGRVGPYVEGDTADGRVVDADAYRALSVGAEFDDEGHAVVGADDDVEPEYDVDTHVHAQARWRLAHARPVHTSAAAVTNASVARGTYTLTPDVDAVVDVHYMRALVGAAPRADAGHRLDHLYGNDDGSGRERDHGRVQIVDARAAERFAGTAPEPRPGLPSGHVPSAKSVPFTTVLTRNAHDHTLLKPVDGVGGLREAFEVAGVDLSDPDARIVVMCGSGVTACVLALALARLGHRHTALYDGSWTEWAAQPDATTATTRYGDSLIATKTATQRPGGAGV